MARINGVTLFLLLITVMIMQVQVKAFRVDMRRVWARNITHAVHRSNARLKTIQAAVTGQVSVVPDLSAPVNSGQNVAEFMMTFGIGTPPVKTIGIIDTASDLIWTQCQPCTHCYSQPDPIFDPAKSSTYNKISCSSPLCSALFSPTCSPDCEYTFSYGDGSQTVGVLSEETVSMWDSSGKQQSIPGVAFGCSHDTQGNIFSESDGVVGLGRGDLSLNSQLRSTDVGSSKFSYCLTSYETKSSSSPLFFGSAAELNGTQVKSTPLIKDSALSDTNSFYYIFLKGISVGATLANISEGTFDIKKNGSGGFIIDSGPSLTYLSPDAFDAVALVLNDVPGLIVADSPPAGFSVCYRVSPRISLPDITFHLEGGADYVVEGKYSFHPVPETDMLCLVIAKMDPEWAVSLPSILGHFQQENLHILYDNENDIISFTPVDCEKLFQQNFNPVSG